MKKIVPIALLITVIFLFSGCGQPQAQEPEQKIEKVTLTGKISDIPEQHMINFPEGYLYSDYFDTDKLQYVIYSKEKIACSGEFTLKGSMIEIEGTSKKPGSDEVYTEKQIIVDSYVCTEPEEITLISNEFENKIVYNMNADIKMLQEDCKKRGGEFNECGSPCAPDAEICIMMCAFTCEFGEKPIEWLTYNNDDLMFSLEYPSNMTINENEGGTVSLQVWGPTQMPETEFYDGISIHFYKEALEEVSLEDFVAAQIAEERKIAESVTDAEPVYLGGVQALKIDIVSLGEFTNYYLPIDEANCLIMSTMVSDPADQGFLNTADKILASITINIPE
ncbi:hypothetical protein JW911_04960 [Candidatus Peregrinibacteria bacterium]|nr:hypothetical protein [Candidatus Peregrinibacteria bacterium]